MIARQINTLLLLFVWQLNIKLKLTNVIRHYTRHKFNNPVWSCVYTVNHENFLFWIECAEQTISLCGSECILHKQGVFMRVLKKL